ncbi:EAL domain-containing response regulator [Chiayiivirga flava]|uniref:EAL domain-containing protein (Putative c-di-GMP-specific phosphodiesterase class I) n=1 Tax=Chiayiivirga flava TaxID=659595 RepID=A0A7W8G0M5_9GAMM|nr:EAL domain-containing response regulator [Chiayiivirga flava]MBB5207938.1 EAL domain-containing protein (putative c-di-GMP-specific phosphodiesterase class I) [Chiayiivirga flava]
MQLAELTVMVVEDHGFQRRMALRLLAELGVVRCAEAADGESALQALAATAQRQDVVIVDLDMPGMDGIEFIGHVAQRKLAHAVVVASALDPALLGTVQTMARAYGLRVLGCVEKPMTAAKLADVLAAYDTAQDEEDVETAIGITPQALAEGLERDEFVPFFQPQATFANGHVDGVEALARWRRRDGSVVRPAQFVEAIEREGMIDRFTDLVLEKACAWRNRWERAGLRLKVSVNVSMLNLADVAAADRFQRIVLSHGVDPRDVVLEITEGSVMGEAAAALNVLARLRLKGFGLSVDDFGTGYSSLSQLSQIPFTELKIDRSFVSGAPAQPRKRAVIEASLELARKLGLRVVAEGVETIEEWQMLAELGCTCAQGYLIGRAVPGDQLAQVISRWRRPDA